MNPKDKHADWLLKPTANELADEVEMWGKDLLALNMKGGIPVIEGAKLLRQQQAEIEALKQIIDANNLNQNIGQFVKPTNEPVAWISRLPEGDVYNCAWAEKQNDDDIPLYTHPVKELTYEDGIEECAQRAEAYAYMSPNFTALAEELRAILRKAQE